MAGETDLERMWTLVIFLDDDLIVLELSRGPVEGLEEFGVGVGPGGVGIGGVGGVGGTGVDEVDIGAKFEIGIGVDVFCFGVEFELEVGTDFWKWFWVGIEFEVGVEFVCTTECEGLKLGTGEGERVNRSFSPRRRI